MKLRISVSEARYDAVKHQLEAHGLEISDDAEYMITETSRSSSLLPVRSDDKESLMISPADVIYIEAFGKEIEVHTRQGTYYAKDRMYQLESLLDPREFLRVSKSVIISRKHVRKIRPSLSMKFILTMSDGTLVDVTRTYYSDFRRFFGI
ncbi:MAG: LytTR family transcriptional regulator [Firmicutes bacterium]|nr:LytTR family transcriptional regulator [Bacillota bacterium]